MELRLPARLCQESPGKVRQWVALVPCAQATSQPQVMGSGHQQALPPAQQLLAGKVWGLEKRPRDLRPAQGCLWSPTAEPSWQWGMGAEVLRATPPPPPRPQASGACLVTTVCVCCVPSFPSCPYLSFPPPRLLLRLSLEVMTILCRCENIETSEGVPLFVTGVAQVITRLLPPLCLTSSLPALRGPGRLQMDSLFLRVRLPALCSHHHCSGWPRGASRVPHSLVPAHGGLRVGRESEGFWELCPSLPGGVFGRQAYIESKLRREKKTQALL